MTIIHLKKILPVSGGDSSLYKNIVHLQSTSFHFFYTGISEFSGANFILFFASIFTDGKRFIGLFFFSDDYDIRNFIYLSVADFFGE